MVHSKGWAPGRVARRARHAACGAAAGTAPPAAGPAPLVAAPLAPLRGLPAAAAALFCSS